MPHSKLSVTPAGVAKNLVLAVSCVSLLLGACNRGGPEANPAAAADPDGAPTAGNPQAALTVTTTTVASEELTRTVPATGSIFPWQEVIIAAEVGGYRVAEVLVDVGSRVRKGQPLVRMDVDMLEAELNSRRAAVRSAEAALANASAALRRGETVAATGAISTADLDTLKAEHIAAQARVDTATADLTTAELRLRHGTVTAPDHGTITSRSISVGQVAQAGQEMLRMLRQNRVEWRAEVPEAQLSRIEAGQSVEITTVDGSVVRGTVRMVAPTVQASNRTGLVYVDITEGDARPGMFARGQIAAGSGAGLLVPVASVVMQDGYSYVFVLEEGNVVERRRVQQARVYGDQIEIASGLSGGEEIAVKGAGFLKDGDIVAVARADDASPGAAAAAAAD